MVSVASCAFISTAQVVIHIINDRMRNHNKGYKIILIHILLKFTVLLH